MTPHPPALPHIPLVGHALEYRRDPVGLIRRGYEELGPVFSIRLGPRPTAVLIGEEPERAFFGATGHALSRTPSVRWMIPLFGPNFAVVTEGEAYRHHHTLYYRPFREAHADVWVAAMKEVVDGWLDGLGEEGSFELVGAARELVAALAGRVMLGPEIMERLGRPLVPVLEEIGAGTGSHLTRNLRRLLPGRRGGRERDRLLDLIRAEVARRRALEPGERPYGDLLDGALEARDPDGRPYPDEAVARQALGYAWIGWETTVGHLAWTLVLLAHHRAYLDRVLEEVREMRSGDGIGAGEVAGAELLHRALLEAERLRPAVRVMGRTAVEDVDVGGYRIPRGWKVLVCPPVAHRVADTFPDPERYDPDRFAPGAAATPAGRRPEDALIGFGAGVHGCAGRRFALLEMKVVLARFLGRYRPTLDGPLPRPTPGPHTSLPRAPVTIRYVRH